MSGRLQKSLINAKVNLFFYFCTIFLSFFSRKVFLDNLGAEFLGLSGTLGNILGYLNLAEFGIGGCISYFLYKPIQSNNRTKINELISLIGYLYRKIGQVILLFALVISAFFPFVFSGSELGYGIIYFAFYSFLGTSLIGYFINYRQILLTADQKNYIVNIYYQSASIVKTIIQIILAYYYKNLFVWVAIEFCFGFIGCIILNWKINKEYPWLKTTISSGKNLLKQYPDVLVKTKQIFIHKIKDFVLMKSDQLFVFAFVSLKMVAFYGNYTIIVDRLSQAFVSVLASTDAGIGNLVAENNKQNIIKVFWELSAVRHFVGGFMCFSLYHLLEKFIVIWVGPEYLLDHSILVALIVYLYMSNVRGVVDLFNHSHGLYGDVWAAWTELAINVTVTLICGYYFGILGILLGKIVSVFLIVILWKPYYLFTQGLKMPVSLYWNGTFRLYLSFALTFIAASCIVSYYPLLYSDNFVSWCLYSVFCVSSYVICGLLIFYVSSQGMRDLLSRLPIKILKRK